LLWKYVCVCSAAVEICVPLQCLCNACVCSAAVEICVRVQCVCSACVCSAYVCSAAVEICGSISLDAAKDVRLLK